MNIGIDLMGGDYAPLEAVKGIQEYLHSGNYPHKNNITITAIGNEATIAPLLSAHELNNIPVVHADEVIGYHEHPTKALKEKNKSSIAIGFHLLATQKIDAFISAGNTGAMLVGALFSIKAIEGVIRPTIATIIPKINGSTGVLLDVGLNADCKPEHLDQFAVLGSLYAQHILHITQPKVGLLNVGEEEGKGNILAQTTYPLLKNNPHIQFSGNVEGRDIFEDKADIIVCDGFTGNVVLKLAESFYDIASKRNLQNDAYLKRFHYENYGGTPVLGVSKPVIIGHGISNAKAFANMIDVAEKMIETELCKKIQASFKA
ncbi:MAG: phosphate acyltransferase PlsX [Hydrotalea flava]|uniref:phosphate acyltransferase PlsX n=1 Tax=Hydrotalea TaxID=1004300 RepID=UPI000945C364|nr:MULTISPECIES: phosphate acyltransferase PlsX [Hydrotalea]MBY0348192.1 phosphate acyltransferase PlsX [Hydrotalea flava]RWZ89789.1 MAG: phosphate acyltransferase PlsX [Hydrotalea sp. AMD]